MTSTRQNLISELREHGLSARGAARIAKLSAGHTHSINRCAYELEGSEVHWLCGLAPLFTNRATALAEDGCERGHDPADSCDACEEEEDERDEELSCSMCGSSDHSERQVLEDGEWDENRRFVGYFDGDGRDLRRSRSL